MKVPPFILIGLVAMSLASAVSAASADDYLRTPMPPGFQVIVNVLEGPVFADAQGRTLYKWPRAGLRNGNAGEIPLKPTCDDHVYRETAGFVTPYPAGLELPDVENRPSCAELWPAVLAAPDAKPVDKWEIVDRPDGRKQWAYAGSPLYTSNLDKRPGEVLGGTYLMLTPGGFADSGAPRLPARPDPSVPPQFAVTTTMLGRLVTLKEGWSIYSYDGDSRNKSNCYDACLDGWEPVVAAAYARPVGDWVTFERARGVYQWAFRGKPVYRRLIDDKTRALDGGDIPRWHNVYMQLAPKPPKGFVLKNTWMGLLLGDARGMTVYKYNCTDDAVDQLACDNPDAPQVYRFAMCGGGDPDRCIRTFPYVIASPGAAADGQVWSTMYIDTKTGKRAAAGQPGALNVWTFRGRPVYTFAGRNGYGDELPGDFKAHAWGEYNGTRNGFRALVYRDDFNGRDLQ